MRNSLLPRTFSALALLLLGSCGSEKVVLSPAEQLEARADGAYGGQDYEEAIDSYQGALQAGLRTVRLHNNLGNALFREERYNAAEQSYLKALELDPEYLFAINNLALTLYKAGDRAEAHRLIGEARETYPGISFLHTTYGYFRFLEGEGDKAREAFERAIEINPNSPAALNNLGVLYLEKPELGEDPLPYLRRAIGKDSRNKLFHDSLGWYYYTKGMFADATIEIGKAFLYDPHNVEVRIHYATVLEWIGKDREALEQWEQVLDLTDDAALRKLALEHTWEIRGRGAGEDQPG
ncbi:tetratricopeptide repeat protein [Candidatus Moduliflexota bacterium]